MLQYFQNILQSSANNCELVKDSSIFAFESKKVSDLLREIFLNAENSFLKGLYLYLLAIIEFLW